MKKECISCRKLRSYLDEKGMCLFCKHGRGGVTKARQPNANDLAYMDQINKKFVKDK